jgi:hypothetical protein
VGDGDFLRAATVLSQARLESALLTDNRRAIAYVWCAQNFIKVRRGARGGGGGGLLRACHRRSLAQADDDVGAERCIRKAGDLVYKLEDRVLLLKVRQIRQCNALPPGRCAPDACLSCPPLPPTPDVPRGGGGAQFKTCYAQIVDQKRKFQDAAVRYIDILRQARPRDRAMRDGDGGKARLTTNSSPSPVPGCEVQVDASEFLEADIIAILTKAAICAVLAPAGPQRQRVMATLMRDDHIASIPVRAAACTHPTPLPPRRACVCVRAQPVVMAMLDRMFHERFIAPADATAFAATLQPHQKATGSDGMSVVQRACLEHNMYSASKVSASKASGPHVTTLRRTLAL